MKFKIEVELDYLSEDGTLDKAVQKQIVSKIVAKINTASTDDMAEKANKLLSDRATQIVDAAYEQLLQKPVTITDQWGKVVKEYTNAAEMIKDRFDKFMLERVDGYGERTNSAYGEYGTRMDHIIKKQLDKIAKEFTEKAVKEVAEKIKVTLNDSLKEKLGERLINVMEIDKVLAKQLKS